MLVSGQDVFREFTKEGKKRGRAEELEGIRFVLGVESGKEK